MTALLDKRIGQSYKYFSQSIDKRQKHVSAKANNIKFQPQKNKVLLGPKTEIHHPVASTTHLASRRRHRGSSPVASTTHLASRRRHRGWPPVASTTRSLAPAHERWCRRDSASARPPSATTARWPCASADVARSHRPAVALAPPLTPSSCWCIWVIMQIV